MAQGEFTLEETEEIEKTATEVFEGIPKSRRVRYLGHMNDIYLYLGAARRHLKSMEGDKTDKP